MAEKIEPDDIMNDIIHDELEGTFDGWHTNYDYNEVCYAMYEYHRRMMEKRSQGEGLPIGK